MNNSLFDMSQYESQSAPSYSADWRDATGTDPAWDGPELYPDLEDDMALANSKAEESSTVVTNVAEEKAPEPKPVQVEVVEELSLEEAALREQLELTVKRGFYYSGKALTQLRERRLYRSTHRKFEDYCQEQFGMKRIYAHYLINAAMVFDNLISQCSQLVNILPTSESQCRPLSQLEPDEQHQV